MVNRIIKKYREDLIYKEYIYSKFNPKDLLPENNPLKDYYYYLLLLLSSPAINKLL